ncbi:MAG: bifunctional folylpolyglutamate synthase/dihydrofolate synthase [Bacteroidales bacterium]|nr:MAG: bifunctional folylpolyglutamate synthase/dihydrofolate synthase [Bacteroidales bacterium]
MNYEGIIGYLYNKLPMYQRDGKAAYKASLENTVRLDKYFKSPHKKYLTVHVGGTNGKGSVCHILTSVLQNAGFKTGLYTSPHLIDFRERIKVNGELISEEYVVKFVNKHISFFDEVQPSFFEMSVFMAFEYFAYMKVDIAIIEVGLGGRLDSTNIINPVLSVITNIGYDHMEFLGNTLEEIAFEKAGIIKNSVPVIIGESDVKVNSIFIDIAKQRSSSIYIADRIFSPGSNLYSDDEMQILNIEKENQVYYPNLKTDLPGIYQRKNILTALACIDFLKEQGFEIANIDIYNGLKKVVTSTGFYGRWQIIRREPRIICDTAHNYEGFKSVISQIKNTSYKNLHIIIGFVKEKRIEDFLEIFPEKAFYYFTKPDVPRGLDENIIYEKSKTYNLKGKTYQSVQKAYKDALSSADKNDMIFIGGSTYIVADFLALEKTW